MASPNLSFSPRNENLQRIKDRKSKIAYLERLLKSGNHIGSGLSLGVIVGPVKADEDYEPTWVECAAFTKELLELMLKSQQDSLKLWEDAAAREYEELGAYFLQKSETPAKPPGKTT